MGRRLLFIAFFLETGFLLCVLPWSAYWDRNYFGQWLPFVHDFITNNFIRGAVSGLGIVNVAAGLGELVSLFLSRRSIPPRSQFAAPQRPAHE